ncbi:MULTISPECIES: YiiG family protein [Enterobacterales]|uniref:YiiG family protein n=1 Tax=Enterobacterales TaxID=91347 RepID=UPI002ED9AFA7
MKRNLLFATIIISIGVSSLTGCDDKKEETAKAPAANTQPASPAPAEKPQPKPEAQPATAQNTQADAESIYDEKMGVYVKCFNALQLPVNRSLTRYASWLKDFKKGPTGKEDIVYGTYGITLSTLASCGADMKHVVALKPELAPIDGVAGHYIDAITALGNTINEMDSYYTQENYKDDGFVKGKALHQELLKNIATFEPVADKYHAAIVEVNDRRQSVELAKIEKAEGKTFHYYALSTVIQAKQINKVIAQDKFDGQVMMEKVTELEATVNLLKQADKQSLNFSFVNDAGQYQLAAKKYIRRIRDHVAFSEDEKEELKEPLSAWMVEDSYPAALKAYNSMIDSFNLLR